MSSVLRFTVMMVAIGVAGAILMLTLDTGNGGHALDSISDTLSALAHWLGF